MNSPVKHLFLDLEDTVITPVTKGWHHTDPINVDTVKNVIKVFQPDHIHLFSFALHNKFEVSGFDRGTRPMLERALDIKLEMTPSVDDDIIPAVGRMMNLAPSAFDFVDLVDFVGKQQAFRLFVLDQFKNTKSGVEVMLLDDIVTNEFFTWSDLKITGLILNIDNLPTKFV